MPEPIVEVQIKVNAQSLRLEWGLPIQAGKWLWPGRRLEVRLYCRPYPDLGKPTLLNSSLDGRQVTKGWGIGIDFLNFIQEESENGFRPGIPAADPTGRFYPMYLDLTPGDIAAGSVVAYPAVELPVSSPDWLQQPVTVWVVFGYSERGAFIPVHETEPLVHEPPEAEAAPTLPDLPPEQVIPAEKRVRRRGTIQRLFISYAHVDQAAVNPIAQRLSREFSYEVWIDYDSIPGGAQWREEIARGIQGAEVVLFMATPTACASRWCQAEIDHARKHGKRIIPVMVSGLTTAEDLKQIGLEEHQWVDFSAGDGRVTWDRLLADLPEVLPRDRDLLDPAKRGLHVDYLRSVFRRLGSANLSYLLDAAPREKVNLADVYVPLKLGVSFNIEVVEGELADWWLRDQNEPRREMPGDTEKGAVKSKVHQGFDPDGPAWPAWEARLKSAWAAYKANHEAEQANKEEKDREPLNDGTYYWNRLESEVAPALMSHLVITGDPGSGKSTLMKHLALCLAGENLLALADAAPVSLDDLDFWPHPAYTPLFIELRSLMGTTFSNPADPVTTAKFLHYVENEVLKPESLTEYLPLLRDQLRDGGVMIFLDGLDEVPDADNDQRRRQIKDLVALLRDTYTGCRILVTSRPYAYKAEDWTINAFGHVELAALDSDRLEELAHKLFTVVCGDEEQAETETKAFTKQLKSQNYPDEIRSSPLFFTLLAGIWLLERDKPVESRLPREKGAIYRRCVEMMIARWTHKDAQGQSTAAVIGLSEPELRQVLELLAYTIHTSQESGDAALFRLGDITNVLEELDLYDKTDSRELRDALAQRAGVIYAPSPKQFRFAHLSFQEHLAACHLKGMSSYPQNIADLLAQSLNRWRNVLELLPGEVDSGQLWRLIQHLLPAKEAQPPTDKTDATWYRLYYAIHWIQRYNLPEDEEYRQVLLLRQQDWLRSLLEAGALEPIERAEMGRVLAEIGDPRPYIGLTAEGLPEIDWVDIPAGEFIYQEAEKLSLPAFQMARYPVTYAQFQAFVDAPNYADDGWWVGMPEEQEAYGTVYKTREMSEQRFKYGNHPRENVAWYQAVAFCRWLSDKLGYTVRLPTEQEWEKAARGTDGREYPYEGEFDATKANTRETGIGQTNAVGIFPDGASPYGLADMSGNVWEWCLNKYEKTEHVAVDDSGDTRGLRGGSFSNILDIARAAHRDFNLPYFRYHYYGFRVCRPPSVFFCSFGRG